VSTRTHEFLIALISAVWMLNFCAPIFMPGYTPPAEVNLVFMGLVSILTQGTRQHKKPDKSKGRSKDKDRLDK
jgi:hypothetical protein